MTARSIPEGPVDRRTEKEVCITRTQPGPTATSHAHQGAMTMLTSRLTQRSCACGVGRRFEQPDVCITLNRPKSATDAGSICKGSIKQRQALDAASCNGEMTVFNIDSVQLE